MFAVIKTGGKQYKVAPNDVLRIEKIAGEPGDTVELGSVLMVGGEDGLTIGAPLVEGQRIMFCRRDRETARADLARMLADLKRRATTPPKGAVYYTCLGRGPAMFGENSAELVAIRDELGDVPLVGFFCNGEISHDRVYGYTGVLSLFL